jgi:hypothetical protein
LLAAVEAFYAPPCHDRPRDRYANFFYDMMDVSCKFGFIGILKGKEKCAAE